MRKFYQAEWHGIAFDFFAKLSLRKIATSEFYQKFYTEFFKRYQSWDQLSPAWRAEKEYCADFLISQCKGSTLLSVGCGMGYIERHIFLKEPEKQLFVHEVTDTAWHWIRNIFKKESMMLGEIPACMPKGVQFDLIYLSATDYAMDNHQLINLLSKLRPFLRQEAGGKCLLLSASFDDRGSASVVKQSWCVLKRLISRGFRFLKLGRREQFWGWMRSQKDYQNVMLSSGYRDIQDGFIEMNHKKFYWISGG